MIGVGRGPGYRLPLLRGCLTRSLQGRPSRFTHSHACRAISYPDTDTHPPCRLNPRPPFTTCWPEPEPSVPILPATPSDHRLRPSSDGAYGESIKSFPQEIFARFYGITGLAPRSEVVGDRSVHVSYAAFPDFFLPRFLFAVLIRHRFRSV